MNCLAFFSIPCMNSDITGGKEFLYQKEIKIKQHVKTNIQIQVEIQLYFKYKIHHIMQIIFLHYLLLRS